MIEVNRSYRPSYRLNLIITATKLYHDVIFIFLDISLRYSLRHIWLIFVHIWQPDAVLIFNVPYVQNFI